MSKIYIFSTLSNDQDYSGIHIKGRANVANKRTLDTARGVVTEVSEAQLETLRQNKVFQAHSRNGFISISKSEEDPEKHAKKNMVSADESAQRTDQTIKKGNAEVKVNRKKD